MWSFVILFLSSLLCFGFLGFLVAFLNSNQQVQAENPNDWSKRNGCGSRKLTIEPFLNEFKLSLSIS